MWSKGDHQLVHLGKFKAAWSTSGKTWILFTPDGEKPSLGRAQMDYRTQTGTGFRRRN